MAGLLAPQNWMTRGLNNPLTHIGMGLLQADAPMMSTNLSDFNNRGISSGLLAGVNSYNAYQQQQGQNARRDALLAAKQQDLLLKQAKAQKEARDAELEEQAIMSLPENLRPLARINGAAVVKAQMANKGGMYAGTGMGAQGANFLIEDAVARFKQNNPDSTPQQVDAFKHRAAVELAKRNALQPRFGGVDAKTGNPYFVPVPPLPAMFNGGPAGQPSAPRAPASQAAAPPPIVSQATQPELTGLGPSGTEPFPSVNIGDMAKRYRAGEQLSEKDLRALGERPGTRMHFVKSGPNGVMTLSKADRPPLPPTDIGKLWVQRADAELLPEGEERTKRLRLIDQKIESSSMGAEAKRALDKMKIAGGTIDFFNEIADVAEGSTGNIWGRITESKMDKSSKFGAVLRMFSDQTAAEGILYAMASTMKTQLGTALSGAAIPKDEWPNYEAQIPQITDSKEARYAKAAAYKQFLRIGQRVASGELSEADATADMRKVLLDVAKGGGKVGRPSPSAPGIDYSGVPTDQLKRKLGL